MLEAGQYPITRHLPKTGQETGYLGYDDGDLERGWWRGRSSAPPNLNKERWLQKTIGGDAIVVDRATGLMWPRDCTAAGGNSGAAIGTWAAAISWAEALNFAGFTDWHLPNFYEWCSIVNFGALPGWYQPPFTNVINNYYWSTTTYPNSTSLAMCMRFQYYIGGAFSKTAPGVNIYALAMREAAI
jgi:hypothetical protein